MLDEDQMRPVAQNLINIQLDDAVECCPVADLSTIGGKPGGVEMAGVLLADEDGVCSKIGVALEFRKEKLNTEAKCKWTADTNGTLLALSPWYHRLS
jgi:hypothetical protein